MNLQQITMKIQFIFTTMNLQQITMKISIIFTKLLLTMNLHYIILLITHNPHTTRCGSSAQKTKKLLTSYLRSIGIK